MRLAEQALGTDDFEHAASLFAEAETIARENGEIDLADRAFCNRCSVLVELDQGADQIPKLKEILLRSDPRNRFLAAYNTGVAYFIAEDFDRAHGYARRATELAARARRRESRAPQPQPGRDPRRPRVALRRGRGRVPAVPRGARDGDGYQRVMAAQVEDNLGYVMMCTDRLEEGLRHCETARAVMEELDADHYLFETLQDLCYGYVLADDLDRAEECGSRAFELAVEHSDEQIAKNCLFLLSEIAVRRGDTFGARRYLRELTAYYPEAGVSEEIIDVFLATDLTSVVNLRG